MARLDHETGGPATHQHEWRNKRQRPNDSTQALAHALLETVRQALDDGNDEAVDVATGSLPGSHPPDEWNAGAKPTGAGSAKDASAGLQMGGGSGQLDVLPAGGKGLSGVSRREGLEGPEVVLSVALAAEESAWQLTQLGVQTAQQWSRAAHEGPVPTVDGGPLAAGLPGAYAAGPLVERHRLAGDRLQPSTLHAVVTASFDSATTTVNTGEAAAGPPSDDAADPEVSAPEGGGSAPRKKQPTAKMTLPGGPCAHCGTTESPQWRRPLTRRVVLCNACGIYFSRHHSLPKRKKMPGGHGSPAIGRSPKPEHIPPRKDLDPVQSIICEEKLEVDPAEGPLPAAGSTRGPRKQGRMAAGQQGDHLLQHNGSNAWADTGALSDLTGLDAAANELPHGRMALSLPLMTNLPVFGGINVIVQSFLNNSLV